MSCSETGLTIRPEWAATTSENLIFECPFPGACRGTAQDGIQQCRDGHTGLLCAVCATDFGLDGGTCLACSSTNSSPATLLGVAGVLATLGLLICLCRRHQNGRSQLAGLSSSENNPLTESLAIDGRGENIPSSSHSVYSFSELASKKTSDAFLMFRAVYQPIRIIVSYIQVVTQIGPVLDLTFPPGIRIVMAALKPLAIDLQGLLQLDCLSNGRLDWYDTWLIRVFVIPGLLLVAVGLRYCYERQTVGSATAADYFKANSFVVVFLCYPGVCNQAFSMFDCREVGVNLRVLAKDHNISCNTQRHQAFTLISAVYVVFISFGIPLAMVRLMLLRMREYSTDSSSDRFVARRVRQWSHISTAFLCDSTASKCA